MKNFIVIAPYYNVCSFAGTIFVIVIYFVEMFIQGGSLDYSLWAILYRVIKYIVLSFPPMNYSLIFIKFFSTWFKDKTCSDCERLFNITCPSKYEIMLMLTTIS
jgi:hypothetical protein